jgi:hypothetical protein
MMPAAVVGDAVFGPPNIAEEIMARLEEIEAEPEDQRPTMLTMQDLLIDPAEVDKINTAIAYLDALARMQAEEVARQQARQRAIERASYALQHAVIHELEAMQQTVAHGQYCTLRLRRNPPAVRIEDPNLIPDEYMRQPPPPPAVPDKSLIRAALDAGRYVPGAVVTRGSRLERK